MNPTNPVLDKILRDMLASGDIETQARAENYRWDERGEGPREIDYERVIGAPLDEAAYKRWRRVHGDYLAGHVTVESPITFKEINRAAALQDAVWSELGEDQLLVRIECLDHAIHEAPIGTLTELQDALSIFQNNASGDKVSVPEAKALLEKLCEKLNANPFAVRPRFAAFAQELADDIEADNWPDRLRDRLGLAHYPKNGAESWPVVLMQYKVKDVRARAKLLGLPFPLTVPTVLDDMPYEVFHPAPQDADYGRTLHLGDNSNCDQLTSEVLHPRIDYKPDHIWKIGTINNPVNMTPEKLAKLRETHIFCLRWQNPDREDFGQVPPP